MSAGGPSGRSLVIGFAIVAVAMFLIGYLVASFAPPSTPSRQGSEGSSGPIVRTKLDVAGSTTVAPIAEEAARKFTQLFPQFKISIAAIGSGPGIKAVGSGDVDIGMSSRDVREEEFEQWPDLKPFKIGLDSIAIVVNPSNPIHDLTLEQVAKIFAGEIVNWREVGGPDAPIHVVTREKGSGTRDCFEEAVMKRFGKEITGDAMVQQGNPKLRAAVAADPLSIGYLSLGFLDATVKPVKIGGVEPTVENVRKGLYPIRRSLYLITRGDPDPAELLFIGYILSPDGQKIVEELGYIALYQVS